jgi:phosphoribosylformimino-5-aminoimidazole carboxamide ribotide isomerase
MIIFPAIDLRQGRVVRLRQGQPGAQTVYGDDPAETARRWAAGSAEWLHVVNLDGAFSEGDEDPVNLRRLAEIRAAVRLPIQFGGGVRTVADVGRALDLGAGRVILGTAAVANPRVLEEALRRYGPERVMVALDARDGLVATHGWQTTSALTARELALQVKALGVQRAIYTDVARDGMLAGVNVAATAELATASGLLIIASGGVSGLADIRALREQAATGIEGVIVGQALYSGVLGLAEAIAEASQSGAPG